MILKEVIGVEKKITTKKSIDVIFSDISGNIDIDLQKISDFTP